MPLAEVDAGTCRHREHEQVEPVGQRCNDCGADLPAAWGCVECQWSASGSVLGRPGEFWFYLLSTCPGHPDPDEEPEG